MAEPAWVKLTISRRSDDDSYLGAIRSDKEPNAHSIKLKPHSQDIFDMNKELTRTMAGIVRKIVDEMGNKARATKKAQKLLRQEFELLAQRGFGALDDLFEPGQYAALRRMIGNGSRVILDIDSNLFLFPWELLYDDYTYGDVDYAKFWGFKYIIHRNIPPCTGGDPPRPEIEYTTALVGLIADRALAKVYKQEIPLLAGLQEDKLIKLLPLPKALDPAKRGALLNKELRFFFSQTMDLMHFACHTRDPYPETHEPQGEYCLLISQNFPLWREDFNIFQLSFCDYPLIILNACGTSPRHPLTTRNMVQKLLEHGARGVITTECLVPDAVAAEFTCGFYPRLLNGQTLGDALFETRKTLLHDLNNPLGLLYALYAPPSTRFIRVS